MQDFNMITTILHLILYVFFAIGLHRLAKIQELNASWLAWIPIINYFLFLQLAEDQVHDQLKGKLQFLFIFILIYNIFVAGSLYFTISIIGLVAHLALMLYAFYFLAKRYSKNYWIHFILAVLTLTNTMLISVFLFRNNENDDYSKNQHVIQTTENTSYRE